MIQKISTYYNNLKRVCFVSGIVDSIYFKIKNKLIEQRFIDKCIELRKQNSSEVNTFFRIIMTCVCFGSVCGYSRDVSRICRFMAVYLAETGIVKKEELISRKSKLEKVIIHTRFRCLFFYQWRRLYHIAIVNGLLYVGLLIRQKMEEWVLAVDKKYMDITRLGLFIESGRFIEAEDIISHSDYIYQSLNCDENKRQLLKRFCKNAVNGQANDNYKCLSSVDIDFLEYINKRKTVIFCHAFKEDYEINFEHDCITWMLDYCHIYPQTQLLSNKCPEISSYNSEATSILLDKPEFVNGVKYLILKNEEDIEKIKSVIGGGQKVRGFLPGGKTIKMMTFLGEYNHLQQILADITTIGAKDIFVTNFNLYYAEKDHMDIEIGNDYFERMEVFYKHDLISNYKFTNTLYKSGIFRTDDMGRRVMELGLERYVRGIEDIHFNRYLMKGRVND